MAALGALAENQRRNERVDRGVVTITGTGTIVLGPQPNASATFVLANPYGEIGGMRFISAFQLSLGAAPAAAAFTVGGVVNTTGQTVGSITYPAGTVLNITVLANSAGTFSTSTTPVAVQFQIWGTLMNQGSATVDGGTF